MTIKETIWQLEDLRKDRKSFLEKDEPDSVFADDIEAIDVAVKALEENAELNRLRAGYEKQKSINYELAEENQALVTENAELKKRLDRMSRTKVNHEIKNPFAFTSGLCCPHCDHKDEYILDLEDENAELKRLLRLAAEDIGRIDGVCAGECDGCPCSINISGNCKWQHADEVEEVLKND